MQSLVSAPTWSPLEKLCTCLTSLRGNLKGWGKFPGKKKTRRLKREENCIRTTAQMSMSIPNLDA